MPRTADPRIRELMERDGISQSAAWKRLHPDNARASARRDNARRRAQKRAWERAKTEQHPCIVCGTPTWAFKKRSDKSGRCPTCRRQIDRDRAALRRLKIEDLWLAGKTKPEIAAALGMTGNHVSVEIVAMRRAGYDLPYRRPKLARINP